MNRTQRKDYCTRNGTRNHKQWSYNRKPQTCTGTLITQPFPRYEIAKCRYVWFIKHFVHKEYWKTDQCHWILCHINTWALESNRMLTEQKSTTSVYKIFWPTVSPGWMIWEWISQFVCSINYICMSDCSIVKLYCRTWIEEPASLLYI